MDHLEVRGAALQQRSLPLLQPDRAYGAEREALALGDEVGFVHSRYAGSMVDGPGLRYVLWTTGCYFRCQYCHNPDTWKLRRGERTTVDAVMAEVEPYARLLRTAGGGVTITGGEPLVQARFVHRVFARCKQLGLHTALDTNGYLGARLSDSDLGDIDLVLLDIKAGTAERHLQVTARELGPVHDFARRLSRLQRPTWIRYVLVPGLTDEASEVEALGRFVSTLSSVERLDVLPFQQLGRSKWDALGREYPLAATVPPAPELVERVSERLRRFGIAVG